MERPFYATVVIDGPFDVRKQSFTIKPEKRSVPAIGPSIAKIGAEFDNADRVLGLGLANCDTDRLLEHSTSDKSMYVIDQDQIRDGLVFTLPDEQPMESIVVWNYNKPGYTDQGISKMDISVWTEKDGWKTVLKEAGLQEAEGSDDYDEPTVFVFKPVLAQKVRFENLTTFDPKSKQVGLSEVRFHGPLGPAACDPQPRDGSQASYCEAISLAWMVGRDAVAHDVYVGQTKETLQFLGRIKNLPEVTVSGLAVDNTYAWRVDEVTENGAVETGPLWSFTTKDSLVGHWKLDEADGQVVSDSSGKGYEGEIHGPAVLYPSGGKIDGAFSFDGTSYVDVGHVALSEPITSLTVMTWIKVDVFDKTWQAIVAKGDNSWRLCRNGMGAGNGIHFACTGLASPYLHGNIPVDDGQWHHVAGVYDGTLLSLYVDGKLDVSRETKGTVNPSEYPVWIGDDAQAGKRGWKGMIDDVRVYDCALRKDQIEQIYQGQTLDTSSGGTIQLVNADLVEEG